MSNELNYMSNSSSIITAFIYNSTGKQEPYSISCTDKSLTGTLIYTGDFPSTLPQGRYSIRYFSGASNYLSNVVKEEYLEWDGIKRVFGMTTAQSLKLDELHQVEGLDITKPLTVTKSTREVGVIQQVYTGDRTNITIATRL